VPHDTLVVGGTNGGAAPATARAWLEVLDQSAIRVPVTARSTRIGRHKDNDIQINNNSVHRRHAVLQQTNEGKFVINDLATRNGVVVNGKRVEQQELADGDVIELGEVRVQFVSPSPEASEHM
jgi:pSer/pThr/pTyr-binding forkhead associated (FHA) protein